MEIRRRATGLDIPARGIIRGRGEIETYVFNVGLVDRWFVGEETTAAPKAERDAFPWPQPLSAAIQEIAEPVRQGDLEKVRADVGRIAGRRVLTGLKRQRLGARAISDLLHVNRVEGLALGGGAVWRAPGDGFELRLLGSYGLADASGTGLVELTSADGIELTAYRQVRDIADAPIIAPLLNSLASQEFGDDYGDYYRATGVRFGLRVAIGVRGEWRLAVARERGAFIAESANPAPGPNRQTTFVNGGHFSSGAGPLLGRPVD